LGIAIGSVLLAASDVFQHVESVLDLFGVGVVRQSLDGIQRFLFGGAGLLHDQTILDGRLGYRRQHELVAENGSRG
jgi:hypothetical protein